MIWEESIKITDLAIAGGTLIGPILAVQAQTFVDALREDRRRRLKLFHSLMRTRASPLDAEHVNALNAVPLEFPARQKRFKDVRESWRVYLNHFSKDTSSAGWGERRVELQTDLLQKMGAHLGYAFDAVELQTEIYVPAAHGDAVLQQEAIRQGLAGLLSGKRPLPLKVEQMPSDPEGRELWIRVLAKLDQTLDRVAKQARQEEQE